jgi:dienelactone hydrolase
MHPTLFRIVAAGLGLLLTGPASFAQGGSPVQDFQSSPGNGVYRYASSTPASIMDLLQPNRPRPDAVAQGQLVLPATLPTDARLPAVVLVHGSGGVYPEEVSYWAKLLNDQGIAALVIDIFGPRGVKSTGEDQSQVPFAADTADAFAALRMLASHPRIDPKRIAVMGFSRGGITALRSAAEPVIRGSAPAGLRFAAHIAVYSGGCAGSLAIAPNPGTFGPEPILFVHGDADDYSYASGCRSYAQRINAAGTPTELVLLVGARHKFDADSNRRVQLPANSKTKEGCPLELDVSDMKLHDSRTGEALSASQAQELERELCADKGASVEGNATARDTAGKAVLAFLKKTLSP